MLAVSRVLRTLALGLVLAAVVNAQKADEARVTDDGRFTIVNEVARQPVQSQGQAGTCWAFGTMSFLESDLERIHQAPVDLSELFPVYNAYVEKAELMISTHGKSRFSEGGLCHDVIEGIREYGIVPAADYSGLCPGETRHQHGEMAAVLEGMAARLAKAPRTSKKWGDAYRAVLDTYIGAPPASVALGEKRMSPKQYADDVLKIEYDKYVEVMSFATSPFWTRAKLEVPDNWMGWDRYYNAPVADMMKAMDQALEKGFSVAVDMDVSERGFNPGKGVADLTEAQAKVEISDDSRLAEFKSGATSDDHLMHVVGTATDKDGGVWYITKNSWGGVGPYKGYLFMSRRYVEAKMLSFMVHADGLSADFLKHFQD
ncbi:MAG: aminopeptidase [Planctomycetes bacterium]|nr:aminopeptidase [Planctomycetota bacterium]